MQSGYQLVYHNAAGNLCFAAVKHQTTVKEDIKSVI